MYCSREPARRRDIMKPQSHVSCRNKEDQPAEAALATFSFFISEEPSLQVTVSKSKVTFDLAQLKNLDCKDKNVIKITRNGGIRIVSVSSCRTRGAQPHSLDDVLQCSYRRALGSLRLWWLLWLLVCS